VPDRLRPLWDFDDLDASQQRLHARLEQETTDSGRAEVLSQLARVESLRGDFDACELLLRDAEAIAGSSVVAKVRIDLERGRKLRSSGDGEAAVPLFEAAFARARESGEYLLAGDAAHMVAISDPERMVEWTGRGLELAESEPDAAYWAGPLLNNLGWHHFESGDFDEALVVFVRALEARARDPQNGVEIEIARYAVGKTLRMLGRPGEAAELLERCIENSEPDPYFHEELSEIYAALGRHDAAREQAELADRLR
jgi:tetratricopeptide (TPR) repeat protein